MKMDIPKLGTVLPLSVALAVLAWAPALRAQTRFNALTLPAAALGNYDVGAAGIYNDFQVLQPITISQLGMFDSSGDDIQGNAIITIQLYQLSGGISSLLLETMTFDAANPGTLTGGYRYEPLARPVTLLPGTYTIAASGFDQQNPVLNAAISSANPPLQATLNSGGGLIQFLGCGLYTNGNILQRSQAAGDSGTPNRFAAGTFAFSAAPWPPASHAADYAALTAGVAGFPVDPGPRNRYGNRTVLNHYGSIAVLDERAFPVIVEPSGTRLGLEVAGTYNGDPLGARCVAFTHEQWGHALNDNRGVLFENAIHWASRKSNNADIVLGITDTVDTNYFIARGYQVRPLRHNEMEQDPNSMPECDAIVADIMWGAAPEYIQRLSDYVASGGGLVITFVPWRFVHLQQTLQPAFWRVNALVQPFGLVFRPSLTQPTDFGFTNIQAAPYPDWFDAFPAAALLCQDRLGQVQLDSLQRAIAMNTIAYAVDGRPDLLAALTAVYAGSTNGNTTLPAYYPSIFMDVVTLRGNQTTSRLGQWEEKPGGDLVALGERGLVEYDFNVPKADVYRLQIAGTQNLSQSPQTNFDLAISVDGVALGHYSLAAVYETNNLVACMTPYLAAGNHKLRLLWDNPNSCSQLRLQGLRVQKGLGSDTGTGGIENWVQALVNYQSGLDLTNDTLASYTSPACLEGRDPYPSLMEVDVMGAEQNAPRLNPHPAPNERWYVDVPLANAANTTLRISYQNGAKSEVRNLNWLPVNTLSGGNYTIRKGDSMMLIARPDGNIPTGAKMQITVGTNQFNARPANEHTTCCFSNAGVFTVSGTYTPAKGLPQSGNITVQVVGYGFTNNPVCWMGKERNWDLPAVPPEANLEADDRLFFETITPLPGNGQRASLIIDQSEPRYLLSRLGTNGPVLDSARVDGFRMFAAPDTYNRVVETYADGSRLVESMMILSPVLSARPELKVQLRVIVGGVTFDDGTTYRELSTADFDALGEYQFKFIMPASVRTANCHSITILQGSELLGTY
jgi:hypothetical protein